MEIQYLDTGVAEGTTMMFCQCEICKKFWELGGRNIRTLGGRNIRTRSQSIVDGKRLIDLSEDTYIIC